MAIEDSLFLVEFWLMEAESLEAGQHFLIMGDFSVC
jgi:hypothetical protein